MDKNSGEKQIQCRSFNGYKPCGKSEVCDELCPHIDIPQLRVLIVHLEALGAVLRATSILPAVKRKFPSSKITWVTKKPATDFFQGNNLVDEVIPFSFDGLSGIEGMDFDIAIVVDKSRQATSVINKVVVDQVYGFCSDQRSGAIISATEAANELWELGLSDQKKFFENKKSENQLMIEAFELGDYKKDEPITRLNVEEKKISESRRQEWKSSTDDVIIGINVGCSNVITYKKLSIDYQKKLIESILGQKIGKIVLLGGREDLEIARKISEDLDVVCSPMDQGIRDGLCSVDACDVILTGDSLGMHMAISLKKWVVAWFGPTCSHEIELYGRGRKIHSQVSCSPCWKRVCKKEIMCYDLVDRREFFVGIKEGIDWHKKQLSFKQPLLEISF